MLPSTNNHENVFQVGDRTFTMNNILCIGAGYVGTLTMTVLAHYYKNINIKIYDKFKTLISRWDEAMMSKNYSALPLKEHNLEGMIEDVYNRNMFFTSNITDDDLRNTDVIFICVNTPSTTHTANSTSMDELEKEINKGIELSMTNVYQSLGELCDRIMSDPTMKKERIVIQKSTVPIETLRKMKEVIEGCAKKHNVHLNEDIDKYYKLVNIPEFLAEGTAMKNLTHPDRIVLGYLRNSAESKLGADVMKCFYSKWVEQEKIIDLDSNSSEMTKIVSNAFLGQRISSINSISELCEVTDADINKISESVGMDARIGRSYLKASMGFGGSCLKKDILSLIFILNSKNLVIQANYWAQVLLMNEYQRVRISKKILDAALQSSSKTVTLFGLSFKGEVNDVRGANSVFVISYLLSNGIKLNLYDPYVNYDDVLNELKLYEATPRNEGNSYDMTHYKNYKDALKNSSVLVFCNNHSIFSKEMSLCELKESLTQPAFVFDLYDNYNMTNLKSSGCEVFKLGVSSD